MIETNVDDEPGPEPEIEKIIPLIDSEDYTKVQHDNELLPDPDAVAEAAPTPPSLHIEELLEKDLQDYIATENIVPPAHNENEETDTRTFLSASKTLDPPQEGGFKVFETSPSHVPILPDEPTQEPPTPCQVPSLKRKNSHDEEELNPKKKSMLDSDAAHVIGAKAAHIVLASFPDNVPSHTREQIEQDLTNTCLENQQVLSQVAADLASDKLFNEFIEGEREKNKTYNEEEARRAKNTHGANERQAQDHDAFYEECTKHDIGNNIINKLIDLFVNLDNMTFGERTTYHMITSATNSALKVAFEKYWAFMNLPENKADKLSILKTLACLIYSNFGNYAKQIFDPGSASGGLRTARCYVLVVIIFWVVGRSIRAFQSYSKLTPSIQLDNATTSSSGNLFSNEPQQHSAASSPQQPPEFILPREQELFRPPMHHMQNLQQQQQFNIRPQYEIRPPNAFYKSSGY